MEKIFIKNWKRYLAEQGEPENLDMGNNADPNDGRTELVEVLTNVVNKFGDGPFSGMDLAQTAYNVCANWMNKTDDYQADNVGVKFSERPGEPTKTKAALAPRE